MLPSGTVLVDNSPGRRVIGTRVSTDGGRSWSCAPTYLFAPDFSGPCYSNASFRSDAPVVLPEERQDPPELQFYRARPFRYGDRWVAAVWDYAPSPLCRENISHCHGPHMGTSWWVNRGALAEHAGWRRPFRWQPPWRHSRVADGHTVLNHAPVHVDGALLWLAAGSALRWVAVPEWRLAGVYGPANAQFRSANLTLPAQPLALNADVAWPGITDTQQCDQLHDLCQAFVMVEVLDAEMGTVVPGYEAAKCVVQNKDDARIALRWGSRDTAALAGRRVQLRFTLRDAVIYSIHA